MPKASTKRKIVINPDEFTLGELELLEQQGISLEDIARGNVRAMLGLVWLHMRRTDPEITLEQVRELKMSDFEVTENPTRAAS